jgi:hypothetical protein
LFHSDSITKGNSMSGYKVLRSFASKSSPGVRHQIRERKADGHVYCSCRGYSSHGHCRHMDAHLDRVVDKRSKQRIRRQGKVRSILARNIKKGMMVFIPGAGEWLRVIHVPRLSDTGKQIFVSTGHTGWDKHAFRVRTRVMVGTPAAVKTMLRQEAEIEPMSW